MFITYFQVRPTKMQWLGMAWYADRAGALVLAPLENSPADFPCVPHNL